EQILFMRGVQFALAICVFIFTKILTHNSTYGLMYVVCWFTFAKLATLTGGLTKLNRLTLILRKGKPSWILVRSCGSFGCSEG
ncbi:MAG: hypothetical protein Q4B32_05470, partial [Clostridia bacterium]|nr:hypothetical protein [Clostridia bacterium]